MSAKPGDSFTLQAPPYHRYIVLTSPDENGDVLAVNFTSITLDQFVEQPTIKLSTFVASAPES